MSSICISIITHFSDKPLDLLSKHKIWNFVVKRPHGKTRRVVLTCTVQDEFHSFNSEEGVVMGC
jgi:hypothetical protein